jgi:formylglycine-generating enzyme required for sulfatase activity
MGWLAVGMGLMFLMAGPAEANNIRVANVALQNQNTDAKTADVVFDLAWSNSWRGADNWDAAWVFVKFRAPGSNNWQHATLSTNSSDHKPAANGTITAVPDGKGAFVYRASGYTGSVNYVQTKLRWNYGTNGYNFAKGELVEVSVHAIEMVYIPAGPFYLGSGGAESGHFYAPDGTAQTTNAFLVSSENAITVANSSGNLYYVNVGGNVGDGSGTISNGFPKGYAAFYCMKYEVSQGQYADFLNKLTAAQDATRYPNYSDYRYTIGGTTTNRSASAPDRACNYLSWADGIAYADWAALRPMTELEFEKACRGPAQPVVNEYAWGTTAITNLATPETGTLGSGTETPNPATANCCYGNVMGGPTRVGIFATATSGRQGAGAGYYGVMELSGNLWERPVTVGNVAGRTFQGTMGDGVLDPNGNPTGNPDWPNYSTASGAGLRGGTWKDTTDYLRSSDRFYAAYTSEFRISTFGSRAVRLAP